MELLQYGGAGKNAADSLMAVDGFNALQDGFSSTSFLDGYWMADDDSRYQYERKGVAIWISTKDIYSSDQFALWIDSTGAEIIQHSSYLSEAFVRCVVGSESDEIQDIHEQKQYSADSYIKDVRDNEVYRFTEIDGKYWLAENLRYKGAVPNDSMCGDDGCFYSWLEAVGPDSTYNVCPEGWRLPSRLDWDEMLTFVANGDTENYSLGGIRSGLKAYNVGYRLCDYRDWKQGDYVLLEANDPYDFSAKHFEFTGFWTSSDTAFVEEYGDEYVEGAWMIKLRDKEAGLWLEEKEDIYPVRCVKDK